MTGSGGTCLHLSARKAASKRQKAKGGKERRKGEGEDTREGGWSGGKEGTYQLHRAALYTQMQHDVSLVKHRIPGSTPLGVRDDDSTVFEMPCGLLIY